MVKHIDEKYIYESPDGGKTVYRRESGSVIRAMLNSSNKPDDLFRYAEFVKIIDMSYKNPALKKALDNLLIIYYTVKDGTE
jgi:ATP sulfurylase